MNRERFQEQNNDIQPEILLSDQALIYARQGWPVFPLAGKIPYEGTSGHKAATTDEAVLTQAWSEHPKANIGLATGNASGVIVLDMDVPEGYYNLKQLQEQYKALPDTRRSSTANGGLHYFFAYPDDGNTYPNVVGLSGHIGIDIRGHGGYVVLPPSRLYGRKYYTWANPETPLRQYRSGYEHCFRSKENTNSSRKVWASPPRPARNGWVQQSLTPHTATGTQPVSGLPASCVMTDFRSSTQQPSFLSMPTVSPRSAVRTPQKKHSPV